MDNSDSYIFEEIVPLIPSYGGFDVYSMIEQYIGYNPEERSMLRDEHHYHNIHLFLIQFGYAEHYKDPQKIDLGTPKSRPPFNFIQLTEEGRRLKKAGSFREYDELLRKEEKKKKLEETASYWDNIRKKYWLPLGILTFISGIVATILVQKFSK